MERKEVLRQLHITLTEAEKHQCIYDPQVPAAACPLHKMVKTLRMLIKEIEAEAPAKKKAK
jgi:hypothetical protein